MAAATGAFGALGMCSTRRDIGLVADTLIEAGAVREIETAAHDGEAFRALVELAQACSSGLVALDLVTRVTTGEIVGEGISRVIGGRKELP